MTKSVEKTQETTPDASKTLFLDELESIMRLMKQYQVTQVTKGDMVITKNIHDNPDFKEETSKVEDPDEDLFYSS